jgi:hypothetical protein
MANRKNFYDVKVNVSRKRGKSKGRKFLPKQRKVSPFGINYYLRKRIKEIQNENQ